MTNEEPARLRAARGFLPDLDRAGSGALFSVGRLSVAEAAVATNPAGPGSRPVLAFVGVVPRAVEGRERLGGYCGPGTVGAVRRRIAADGESRGGRDGEGGGEADQSDGLEHGMGPQSWIVPVLEALI